MSLEKSFWNGLYVEQLIVDEQKPTLVFLHDSLGCVKLWRDFPLKIAKELGCNLLMYDRLGYGESQPMFTHVRTLTYLEDEAHVLYQLLNEFDIDEVILFGHSDGGSIALLFASLYPEKTLAVIAEAAHIFVEDVTLNGVKKAVEMYNTTNLPERLEKYHGDKVETIFKAWTETWLSDDFSGFNVELLMQNITSPLLFIQGEKDEYGSLKQVSKTVEKVQGKSETLIIPEIGHTPHKEIPELVIDKTVAFIKEFVTN